MKHINHFIKCFFIGMVVSTIFGIITALFPVSWKYNNPELSFCELVNIIKMFPYEIFIAFLILSTFCGIIIFIFSKDRRHEVP